MLKRRTPIQRVTKCGTREAHLVMRFPHHVKCDFRLRDKLVPKVDGERGVGVGQDGNEVSFECLDCAFSLVGSFRVRWDKFVSDIVGDKVLSQGFRSFVVHDLNRTKWPSLENHW